MLSARLFRSCCDNFLHQREALKTRVGDRKADDRALTKSQGSIIKQLDSPAKFYQFLLGTSDFVQCLEICGQNIKAFMKY